MTFELVCALDDLPAVGGARAQVGDSILALIRAEDGSVHAIEDECSHGRVSLSEGEVSDCLVECWLHGSRFDLVTGEPVTPPATAAIAVYAVRVEDGQVYVDPQTPINLHRPLTKSREQG